MTTAPPLDAAAIASRRQIKHRRFLDAAKAGQLDEMKEILKTDPIIYKHASEETVGFLALRNKHHHILHFLLEEMTASLEDKAIIARGNPNAAPLVYTAIESENTSCVNLLLKHDTTSTNFIGNRSESLLMHALVYRQPEAAQTLLDRGADTSVIAEDLTNCLHWASYGNVASMKVIYPHVPHLREALDNRGHTPLLSAVYAAKPDIVKFYLEQKPNLKATDGDGNSALHLAQQDMDMNAVLMTAALLDGGCCIDMQNNKGETALLRAEDLGMHKTADLLLARGADIMIADKSGKTVADYVSPAHPERLARYQNIAQEIATEKQRQDIKLAAQAAFKGTRDKTPVMRKIVLKRAP